MEKKKKILKIIQVVYDILSFGFILFMIIALCVGNKQNVKQNQKQVKNVNNEVSEVVGVKNRQLITYDESTYTVTYNSVELVDSTILTNIYNVLFSEGYNDSNRLSITGYIVYNNTNVSISNIYYANVEWSSPHEWLRFVATDVETYQGGFEVAPSNQTWLSLSGGSLSYSVTGLSITSEIYYNLVVPPVLVDELFTAVTDTAVAFTDTLTDSVDAVGDMFWDSANNRITPLASLILIVIGVGLVYWSFRLIFRLIRRA